MASMFSQIGKDSTTKEKMTEEEAKAHVLSQKELIKIKMSQGISQNITKNIKSLEGMQDFWKDQKYKEADGLYVVLEGNLDLVSHTERGKKIYTVDLLEYIGESVFMQQAGYEYLGDIYAGFPEQKASDELILNDFVKKFGDNSQCKTDEHLKKVKVLFIPRHELRSIPIPDMKAMYHIHEHFHCGNSAFMQNMINRKNLIFQQ
jgi:hypothetical protein